MGGPEPPIQCHDRECGQSLWMAGSSPAMEKMEYKMGATLTDGAQVGDGTQVQCWMVSPCRLMSRPSTSTSGGTRKPMIMSSTLRMMKVTTAQ